MMRFFRFALHALILILHIEIQVRIDQTLLPLRREVTKNGKLLQKWLSPQKEFLLD